MVTGFARWATLVFRGQAGGIGNKPGCPSLSGTAKRTVSLLSAQIFLLHVNDVTECNHLYGGSQPDADVSGTCWVLPSSGTTPTATATNALGPSPTPTNTLRNKLR